MMRIRSRNGNEVVVDMAPGWVMVSCCVYFVISVFCLFYNTIQYVKRLFIFLAYLAGTLQFN